MSRLVRNIDFACRQDDGSILFVFADTDLRAAHVAARRLASVLKHTMLRSDRDRAGVSPAVTLATLKPGDTALTLLARVAPAPGCRRVIAALNLAGQPARPAMSDTPRPPRRLHDRRRFGRGLPLVLYRKAQA